MPTFKATSRLSVGGKLVEPGEQFETDEDSIVRMLGARGMVEPVKSKAPAKQPEAEPAEESELPKPHPRSKRTKR